MSFYKYTIFSFGISLLLSFSVFAQKKEYIDSLQNVLSITQSDSGKINTMSRLAFGYIEAKKVNKAKEIVGQAYSYAEENGLKIPYLLDWAKAKVLFYKKDAAAARDIMLSVVEKTEKLQNKVELAQATNFLAWTYLYNGEFSKSIETFEGNIQFAKNNNLVKIIPSAYNGLSVLYQNLDDTELRRKSLIMMADAAMKEKDKKSTAEAYFMLGDLGMEKDSNFTYAIQNYQECLKIRREMQDTSAISFLILRIGWNHYLNGELDTALDYCLHSLEYSMPVNLLKSITNAYGNIGTIYRDKKEYKKAIKYYKESIKYSQEAKDWYNLSWLYKDISDMFIDLNDYPKAYDNFVLHKQYSDSLEMSKFNTGLANARAIYETEKQEKEERLVYASELKTILGLDQSNISDDEAISSVRDDRANTREENIYSDLVRWHDIKTYLKEIDQLEAKVFLMSFHLSNLEISKSVGKSENQIAKIKCKVKKYLMKKFSSEKE